MRAKFVKLHAGIDVAPDRLDNNRIQPLFAAPYPSHETADAGDKVSPLLNSKTARLFESNLGGYDDRDS